MLSSVGEARKQLESFIREHATTTKMANAVIASLRKLEQSRPKLDVVLVFLGQKTKRGLPGLPLLAKLELSDTARQIGQLGFTLSVAQVGVN